MSAKLIVYHSKATECMLRVVITLADTIENLLTEGCAEQT
jgi:hypothetical protein